MKIRRDRKRMGRGLALLLVLMLVALCFTACDKKNEIIDEVIGSEETQEPVSDVIIQVGEKTVGLDEIMFYVLCLRQQYEGYFGEEIWSVDMDGRTFEDMCKEDILNEIIQLKVITTMAESQGVVVTDDEMTEIRDTVAEQMNEIDPIDAILYHIDEELLLNIYHDNYLSSKMFEVSTSDVDTVVSDEEAHHAQFMVLTLLTEGTDKNFNQISMTQEEKDEAWARAQELRADIIDVMEYGTDEEVAAAFESMAIMNSDLAEIHYTIGRNEMKDAAFKREAFALKTGGMSRVVEGDKAIFVIYCVNSYDEDATAEAKEEIILARQDDFFRSIYEEWLRNIEITVDEEQWTKVSFTAEDLLGVPESE